MNDTLTHQQLAKEGQAAYKRKDYLAAAHAFEAAAGSLAATGNRLEAAEMANNCSVAFLQAGDGEAALMAVMGTEVIFSEAGDILRQAVATGNRAAALEAIGWLEEAAMAYQESADLLKKSGETELRVQVMQALSKVHLRLGQRLEALATMQSSLEGIKHPTAKQRLVKKMLQAPFKMLNG